MWHHFLVDAVDFADSTSPETPEDNWDLAPLSLSCQSTVSSKERSQKGWSRMRCGRSMWHNSSCQEHAVGSGIQTPPVQPVWSWYLQMGLNTRQTVITGCNTRHQFLASSWVSTRRACASGDHLYRSQEALETVCRALETTSQVGTTGSLPEATGPWEAGV